VNASVISLWLEGGRSNIEDGASSMPCGKGPSFGQRFLARIAEWKFGLRLEDGRSKVESSGACRASCGGCPSFGQRGLARIADWKSTPPTRVKKPCYNRPQAATPAIFHLPSSIFRPQATTPEAPYGL